MITYRPRYLLVVLLAHFFNLKLYKVITIAGYQPNKWWLMVDLSHPTSGISLPLYSLHYVTVDDAVHQIFSLSRGCLLAKVDIQSAFCLLPVHPVDRHLLLMKWNGKIYVDTCLPFGLRTAPKLLNILADLLEWILITKGVCHILHYLNDFLILNPVNASRTWISLSKSLRTLGFP